MTPQRWSRIREILETALDTSEPERSRCLDLACGEDVNLRAEVERLLLLNQEHSLQSPVLAFFQVVPELSPGDIVAHYRIQKKLGEGGMGVVHLAYDTKLNRTVALKLLHSTDPNRKQGLLDEARAASALNHPNIVTVYEIGSQGGFDFIAMEYVPGQSLARAIPPEGLPVGRALHYAIQLAAALVRAHAAGIIHRDLKPANVMLSGDDGVKLLDFGLARYLPVSESGPSPVTEAGISGTVGYMSPEQVQKLPLNYATDLFSFGLILYEMLTGRRPFHEQPLHFGHRPLPGRLKSLIRKLLDPDPIHRGTTEQAALELRALVPTLPLRLSRKARVTALGAFVTVAVMAGWLWRARTRERWALRTAVPEINRLIEAGEYRQAASLTGQARNILAKDPVLEKLRLRTTGEASVDSEPAGAEVSIRPYREDPKAWESLGKTPLHHFRVPRDVYLWRLSKAGFAPAFFIAEPAGTPSPGAHWDFNLKLKLRPEKTVPPEMVVAGAGGGFTGLTYPLAAAPIIHVDDFLVDRHEVSNVEYKKFVDAGGYRNREFWRQPFLKDGRVVRWEQAMAQFHDRTGQPGPATWENGSYSKGRAQHPVAGLSWYEAAAYAAFAGKSLPTAYHWTFASQTADYPGLIAAAGNFRSEGTQPVGSELAASGFGTTDMAGNVKEWCWNEARGGKRLILGGGFGEPPYQFNFTDAQSPWARQANFGFRCVKLDSPASPAAMARIEVSTRDYWTEKPVSNEVYQAYCALYAYDKGEPLHSLVEETVTVDTGLRQRVSFDAAYGRERVTAYIFLPKRAPAPVQTVVFYPGAGGFLYDKLELDGVAETYSFLLGSGRALIVPIYKGMYERRDNLRPGGKPPALFRDHVIAWSKDLGRTLDYLETRQEFDGKRVAYLGDSMGGVEGSILMAVDRRIRTAIFSAGGFQLRHDLPEVDPFNFAPHVTVPVLMLNGRYDDTFPVESSQRPLFHFLGTPLSEKKHLIYEAGHIAFTYQGGAQETLAWLDKYLGPVQH